jgi:hypothetical protein
VKSEVAALLDRTERHLARGDAAALRQDVEGLDAVFLRQPTGERERFDRLERRILRALRAGLPLEQFLEVARLAMFHRFEVYRLFDAKADDLALEEIVTIVAALGAPKEGSPIRARLATDEDPRIVPWLDMVVRRSSAREAGEGTSLSHHQRTMSSFQVIRWLPDDAGLSSALEILAARPEAEAEALLHRYLEELPWGADRRATMTLLQALVDRRSAAGEEAVHRALDVHTQPGPLRVYLIQALAKWSRAAAVDQVLDELDRDLDARTRIELLDLLEREIRNEDPEAPPLDLAALAERLESLDTRTWSRLERGGLAELGAHVPGTRPAALAGLGDRFLAGLVRSFMAFRLEHMGCLITLPLSALLFWGTAWVLDRVLARPSPGLALLEVVTLLAWLAVLAGTSHTHFSGHESLRQRLVMATLFWGATLAVPVVLLGTRLPEVDPVVLRRFAPPATAVLAGLCLVVLLARRAPRLLASLFVVSAVAGVAWLVAGAERLPALALWATQVAAAVIVAAAVAGSESFSLPFDTMALATILVGVLAPWFGWSAVAWVLGVYAALLLLLGLIERLGR